MLVSNVREVELEKFCFMLETSTAFFSSLWQFYWNHVNMFCIWLLDIHIKHVDFSQKICKILRWWLIVYTAWIVLQIHYLLISPVLSYFYQKLAVTPVSRLYYLDKNGSIYIIFIEYYYLQAKVIYSLKK